MRHPSRRTLARAAACGGVIALAAGFAPAAAASPAGQTSVPCKAAALASALSGAASGGILVLAAGCTYHVTGPLPAISGNLTIDGRGATVAGHFEDPGFGILSVPSGVSVHIRDLNFTGGGDPYVCGGAINTSGDVAIEGGTFRLDGAASPDGEESPTGGAICNGGQLTVNGVTFTSDDAQGAGGAIDNGGELTVIASRFTGNRVFYGAGGAIYNGGTLTVVSSSFSENSGQGGAIGNWGHATLRDDTLSGNGPGFDDGIGGAIYNAGTLTVSTSSLSNNGTDFNGGAIDNHGQLTLRYDSLSGNKAVGNGGAIENLAALTVVATAITGNTAGAGGAGGIDNEGGTVDVRRDLIQSNLPVNCSNVPGCTD
jgi:hypothetical protein